jgi:AAA+ superfamily predicted ATPase
MSDGLFEQVLNYPDPDAQKRYIGLVGLDAMKERLEKEAEAMLRPDLLETWSKEKHGLHIVALDTLLDRAPLFIFAGDVGTGKTELATNFGDRLARATNIDVELYNMSLRARGSGLVGEMTTLISDAVRIFRTKCPRLPGHGKKPTAAAILLIDEADALAQSREMAQMHHEDRAGVNALIRGLDDIAKSRLAGLVIMSTNRLEAIDPAIRRRAAATFEFKRPDKELRKKLVSVKLAGTGLGENEFAEIAEAMGETKGREYGYTCSDITQRFVPTLVLAAYPDQKITKNLALRVVDELPPSPPFTFQ